MNRRMFLGGVTGAVLMACHPSPNFTKDSKYELQRDGIYLVDQGLVAINHPFLEAIRFSFDPHTDNGRFVAEPTYKNEGELRLVTEELTDSNRGFIYNHPWNLVLAGRSQVSIEKPGNQKLVPVIRVREGEEYLVRFGYQKLGEPYRASYTDMRTYFLTRDATSLSGRVEGQTTLDPETIRPRDNEASSPNYWRKESLG